MTGIKRSTAVPLSLVPALASLVACGPSAPAVAAGADPCLPQTYQQAVCETAVANRGYYYGGAWYPHVYSHPALFYYNGYSGYVGSGGRVRAISPGNYSPSFSGSSAGRSSVVRGGFGAIGGSRGFSGS